MATYYIYRKDSPGGLSPRILAWKLQAFRTLFCGQFTSEPVAQVIVRGEWYQDNHTPSRIKDGLYLQNNSGAEIIRIGTKYVTLKYRNDVGVFEEVQVVLDEKGAGFTQIMFISMPKGRSAL